MHAKHSTCAALGKEIARAKSTRAILLTTDGVREIRCRRKEPQAGEASTGFDTKLLSPLDYLGSR